MTAFWESLDLLGKILFCTGFAGSVALLIQIVIMLIGFAGGSIGDFGDFDGDVPDDVDGEISDGAEVGLFTVKGVVAFLAIGGWCGLGANIGGLGIAWSLVIAAVTGAISFVGVGFLYRGLYKLQSDGKINAKGAIGKIGEVYLTIPEKDKGIGKVNVTLQERFTEFEARTKCERPIKTGEKIKVVAIEGDTLLVEPFEDAE